MHNSGTQIRNTRAVDINLLADIERRAAQLFQTIPELAWLATAPVMSTAEHLAIVKQASHWVATCDGQPAGFLAAEPMADALHIQEVSVDPAHQGRRIGADLIRHAIRQARKIQKRVCTLTTFREVPWNRPYYERLGFRIIAEKELPPYLNRLLIEESDHGLQREQRCAMSLDINQNGLPGQFQSCADYP